MAEQSPDDAVRGTLMVSDDEFRLTLEGSFRDVDNDGLTPLFVASPSHVDRILGETVDRKDITLHDCTLAGSGTHGKRGGGTTYSESYWPDVVLLGGWFWADEDVAFDKIFVRLTSLHPWTEESGFGRELMMPVTDGETATQTFTAPKDRSATLSDGTVIKLTFPLDQKTEGSLFASSVTLTQATRFEFDFPEPVPVKDVQRHVYSLRNLLTLAVGEAVKVTELFGYRVPATGEVPPIGGSVEILYRHVENPRAREVSNQRDMLFVLRDMDERFEEHIVRWFERMPELGRVLDLYFSTQHVEFMYLETRFMNYVQAVEGYHRRRLNRPLYDDATFEAHSDAILEHVSGRTRKLAKKALRFANELSLEDRIRDVLTELGEPGNSVVLAGAAGTKLDATGFANRVATRRNAFAHDLDEGDPGEDDDFDDGGATEYEPHPHELAIFMFQLRAIVQALLLLELGFDSRTIDKKLEQSRQYRRVTAIATG